MENKAYLEYGLPRYLKESIEQFIEGERKRKEGNYFRYDGDYGELQSNINVAEVGGEINSEQAWYLREKYLGIRRE